MVLGSLQKLYPKFTPITPRQRQQNKPIALRHRKWHELHTMLRLEIRIFVSLLKSSILW